MEGSRATTCRRSPVTVISFPSIRDGVARGVLGPKLDASHLHATSRSSKFETLISAAGAYRVCHASPPRKVQSPLVVPRPLRHAGDRSREDSAESQGEPKEGGRMPRPRGIVVFHGILPVLS